MSAQLSKAGMSRSLAVTAIVLLLSHGLDLYDSSSLGAKWDQMFRLLLVLGLVAFTLAAVDLVYRHFLPGRVFLPGLSWWVLVILTVRFWAGEGPIPGWCSSPISASGSTFWAQEIGRSAC